MELSARNQLQATVTDIKRGNVMAEVVMRLGDGTEPVSAITLSSVDRLNLQPGDEVVAVARATEVMVGRP